MQQVASHVIQWKKPSKYSVFRCQGGPLWVHPCSPRLPVEYSDTTPPKCGVWPDQCRTSGQRERAGEPHAPGRAGRGGGGGGDGRCLRGMRGGRTAGACRFPRCHGVWQRTIVTVGATAASSSHEYRHPASQQRMIVTWPHQATGDVEGHDGWGGLNVVIWRSWGIAVALAKGSLWVSRLIERCFNTKLAVMSNCPLHLIIFRCPVLARLPCTWFKKTDFFFCNYPSSI